VQPNPFHPSFGVSPPLLVGRDSLIQLVDEAITEGAGSPARATLYTGPRGAGKTVLLNAVESKVQGRRWEVVRETAIPGFVDRLVQQHLPVLLRKLDPKAVRRRLSRISIPLGPLGPAGIDWTTVDAHIVRAGLRSQIEMVTDLLADEGRGLLLTLDEVHRDAIDELRLLGATVQHAFREERAFIFVGAGLASAVKDVVNDRPLTFLRRADHHHLGAVGHSDVAQAIKDPIQEAGRSVSDDALSVMVDGTGGYPFLIQLVAYRTWAVQPSSEVITAAHAHEGVEQARRRLGSLIHEPALADASDVDRTFLLAMAKDDGPSKMSDIQQRLRVNESYVSQYRLRLIATELIEPKGHGYVDFALPYMREYLRDEAAAGL